MKKLLLSLLGSSMLLVSVTVNAVEVDFMSKFNDGFSATPKIISTATFEDSNLSAIGSYTVNYSVYDTASNQLLASAFTTISSNETQVTVGKVKEGKLTLTYDSLTDQVDARFVYKASSNTGSYTVGSTVDDAGWSGSSVISSGAVQF